MEAFFLLIGLLFVAGIGYDVVSRLDRFLDRGGLPLYWDVEEEEAAQKQKAPSGNSRPRKNTD